MKFPPYPRYKDSGIDWLGEIPEHWKQLRLSWLFRRSKTINRSDAELLSIYRDYGVIPKSSRDDNFNKPSDDLSTYQLVEVGDLVLNKMKTWQGSIAISEFEGIVSPAYFVAKPQREFNLRFVHYLLRSPVYISQYLRYSKGIRPNQWDLDFDDFRTLPAILPPLEEQKAIAEFLNTETLKIDELIGKQERLIGLLQEKRQALISCAVTKGLNPTAPMKDSGVEWLGETPAHWEISTIGRIANYLSYGFTNPMPTTDEGAYLLTANDIGYGEIFYETARRTSYYAFTHLLTNKSRPQKDDILITKDGTLGRVAIHDGQEACINQSVALLCVNRSRVLPKFIALALLGSNYQSRMLFEAGGTTIKHIYISRFSKMWIVFPDLDEQERILNYLNAEVGKINILINKAYQAVGLLQEHRTALISSAVTGKIDVKQYRNGNLSNH